MRPLATLVSSIHRFLSFTAVLVTVAACNASDASAARYYVDASATGANNGSSWSDAYTDLQTALSGRVGGDVVWVAAGTYKPHASDRTMSFAMQNAVSIYGGFDGSETMLGQRDVITNVTILSGDIGVPADSTDNSYHVVTAAFVVATAILDGFTIEDGFADETAPLIGGHGGGVYVSGGNPRLSNLTVRRNTATVAGGGMSLYNSQTTVNSCVFTENRSHYSGGAIAVNAPVTFRDIIVFDNHADVEGGGIDIASADTVWVINAAFVLNSAGNNGGAILVRSGSPRFVNITVDRNTSGIWGGGAHSVLSSPYYINASFSRNASARGGAIYSLQSTPTVINCIMWADTSRVGAWHNEMSSDFSTSTISYSDIEGSNGSGGSWDSSLGTDGGNNIDADPLYFNPAGGILSLNPGSPCIDAGNNAGNAEPLDIYGNARTQGAIIDMGAIESPCPSVHIVYVDAAAGGANDGTSWADAFVDLQDGIASTPSCISPREIWVKASLYLPGTLRTDSFVLQDDLAIYGGFDGTETQRSQRNPSANVTQLSGDIGVPSDDSDNCYHVVDGSGVGATAVLDGFWVVYGNADSSLSSQRHGGGIYMNNGSPTLANLRVWLNKAEDGGGLYCESGSAPSVTDCVFEMNNVTSGGGGAFCSNSDPVFVNVFFKQNTSDFAGGGVCNYFLSNPTYTNTLFLANTALAGGAMASVDRCEPTLTNVTMTCNVADDGGGIASDDDCTLTIVNSIVWSNVAFVSDPEILNGVGSDAVISYSDIDGSNGSGGSWNASLGTDAGNNIDANPDFSNPGAEDYSLASTSPAIDAGNSSAPNLFTPDLGQTYRFVNGVVDMGAYEYNVITGIDPPVAERVLNTSIRAVYPNPFNPTVTVVLDLAGASEVSATVYDVGGRRVWSANMGVRAAGIHRVRWHGVDDNGGGVSSGVYFVRVEAGAWNATQKVVLLK